MANYVHRIHLNRPIKTRLIIAVRFVVTAAISRVSPEADVVSHSDSSDIIQQRVAPSEQRICGNVGSAATVGVRGTVAMRLRVVGQEMPTLKEYHHAESLPA